MSDGEHVDTQRLRQIDDRLQRGVSSGDPVIESLAATVPQADEPFRDALEQRLLAHFESRVIQKKDMEMQMTGLRVPQRTASPTWFTWLAAVLAVVVVGGGLLALDQRGRIEPPVLATQITTDDAVQTLVVATRNIDTGETITADMVAVISLAQADYARLQASEPEREFYADLDEVVGQTTTTAIFWFEPVEPVKLGQLPARCAEASRTCVTEPEGYATLYLSQPVTPLESLGLVAGDRVDVLASADNQLVVVADNVLLAGIEPERVLLAAPYWKHSLLVWLYQTGQSYVLRPHQGQQPAPADDTRVEFTFTAPEPLPEDYRFDLIAEVNVAEGYRLQAAPYTLDETQYTQRDTIMNFWYTDLEVIRIVDETNVTIRLPQSDAANLEFLMAQGVKLTFIPDASQN